MEVAENYLGQITHVIDPDNFSMQIGTDESLAEFIQFEMRLEDFGQTCNRVSDLSALDIGQIVLVECMETKEGWRRGQVANVNSEGSGVDIVYIDFGHSEHVIKSRLCADFPDEFVQYPSMALKCQLAGIRPIARTWTTKAVKMFIEITQGIIFHTFFLPSTHMFKSTVTLYLQQGADNSNWAGRSLSHVLMDQELGIVSENEVTEFLENAAEFSREKLQMANFMASSETNPDILESEEIPNSNFLAKMSNEEVSEEEEDLPQEIGESAINDPSVGGEEESHEGTSGPSTDEVISDYSNSPDGPLDNSPESLENRVVISDFDFDRIHHTKNICTNRLEEKKAILTRQQLEQENEKIIEDVKECKNLAVEAGYGEVDHFEKDLPPRFASAGRADTQNKQQEIIASESPKPFSSQSVIEDRMPSKRYSLTRREGRPGVEERMELKPFRARGRGKRSAALSPSRNGPVIGSSGTQPSRNSPVFGSSVTQPSRSSPVIGSSVTQPSRSSPVIGSSVAQPSRSSPVIGSSVAQPSRSSPVIGSSGKHLSNNSVGVDPVSCDSPVRGYEYYTPDTPSGYSGPDSSNMTSPKKREELVQTLRKVFAEAERESEEETRARLQSLFYTDLYMYLDTEQLSDVIYLLLNRAVRYYGDIHDVLLDIVQILSVTGDFSECLYQSCKKIEENYIKIQLKGSPFHVQASKVLAHIYTMSVHWNCGDQIQEMVLSALEKWIIFNKTAQQFGQGRLQELYIECFDIVWCIVGSHICERYPERKARLQKECRDKILNDNVSRLVRSKLLDIYIEKFVISSTTRKEEAHTQTSTLMQVDVGVQTDMIKIKGKQSLDQSPAPQTSDSKKNSKTTAVNHKSKASKAEIEKDKEWPKLSSPKVPDWTNLLLESPKTIDWSSSEGDSVFRTPDSLPSSLYLTAEDKSYQSSPVNGKQSSYLNSPDNLRRRNLNQLRKPLHSSAVSEPQQTFTNWSDNMVFGSKSNFLSGEHAHRSADDEIKSQILQSRVCALAEPTGLKAQTSSEPTRLKGQSSSFQQTDNKKDRPLGVKEVSSSSNKKVADLKEEQKMRSKEPVSWWDSTGSVTGSKVPSSSHGSDYDSSGSEKKRSVGRGRGKRVKKEITAPQRMATPGQKADDKQDRSENHAVDQKRVNPLRTNENPLKPQNINANCNQVSGANSEKSPQKVMDWFSMEEVVTGAQPSRKSSNNDDDVPDDWFLASDDEKSAKHSQSSDMQRSVDSDKLTNPMNTNTSLASLSGDSPSASKMSSDIKEKFDGEDGSGDGQSRLSRFSDDEGEDDGLWETDSSADEMNMEPVNTTDTTVQTTGVPKWVPGQRTCTLCGAADHVIYECPQKKERKFFL